MNIKATDVIQFKKETMRQIINLNTKIGFLKGLNEYWQNNMDAPNAKRCLAICKAEIRASLEQRKAAIDKYRMAKCTIEGIRHGYSLHK